MSRLNLKVRPLALAIRSRACLLAVCAFAVIGIYAAQNEVTPQGGADAPMVRIILSSGTISGANTNDALVAFRVWTYEMTKGLNVPVADQIRILDHVEDISRELNDYPNHLVSLSIPEYLSCGPDRFGDEIYVGRNYGVLDNRYLLLVRDDGPIAELGDLAGKTLACYKHRETAISEEWFQYQLIQADLKPARELLKSYSMEPDLSKTVLGVFFGNRDACLVSENSFKMMCELNPQLKTRLRVLMQSPRVIVGAMFLQADYDPELKLLVEKSLDMIGKKPSGQQVLTLFRSDSTEVADVSVLDETIGLYKKWIQSGGDEI